MTKFEAGEVNGVQGRFRKIDTRSRTLASLTGSRRHLFHSSRCREGEKKALTCSLACSSAEASSPV
jgi:hypothetical protein